jgi:transcriptional regulator with XRE-family HTH domain
MTSPLGPELRAIRHAHGLSLQRLEEKSDGRWKAVVVGSYERGNRHPTVDQVRDLLAWYGDYSLPVLHPGDVIHRAGQHNGEATVRYVVEIVGTRIDCTDRTEAQRLADSLPSARAGYQLVGPVIFEEES